jgi:hypothetical protein
VDGILDRYRPRPEWFAHNPYGIHGIAHADFGKLKWPRFGILKWPRCLGCGVGRHRDLAHSPVAAECGTLIWPYPVWVFLLAA